MYREITLINYVIVLSVPFLHHTELQNFLIVPRMCDLICDVISRIVWSCDVGKINVYDKIIIENQKKRENMEIKEIIT